MEDTHEIRSVERLGRDVVRLTVRAERPARFGKAGQFVIVRVADDGERIPLTICEADPATGTIVLVVQVVGATTWRIAALSAGEALTDVAGPLGRPTETGPFGDVVVVAGGVGAAITLPVARALAAAGNRVEAILGARSADLLILTDEFDTVCHRVEVCTDDGTAGRRGTVVDVLHDHTGSRTPDLVHAAGPIPMMRAVAQATRPAGIPTVVSLNPIMVDGTGMCGGCRVAVGGTTRFACVDGPEFDAHGVDFDRLVRRNRAYVAEERHALAEVRRAP